MWATLLATPVLDEWNELNTQLDHNTVPVTKEDCTLKSFHMLTLASYGRDNVGTRQGSYAVVYLDNYLSA